MGGRGRVGRRAVLAALLVPSAALVAACGAAEPAATSAPTAAAGASAPAAAAPKPAAALEKLELAADGQLLCTLPYEVARRRGLWEAERLDVTIGYMRGDAQAMNALLAGSGLDWAATGMDLVVQAQAKGQRVQMLVSTATRPLFALVGGPKSGLGSLPQLRGKRVGVANVGTTDHLLAQLLARRAGVEPSTVEFVPLGPNLYDLLLKGEVDAGMVQEPALTLSQRAGAKVLVNLMSEAEARQQLGGEYQFAGLVTRADVLGSKRETAARLVRGLVAANRWIRANPGTEIIRAAPTDLVPGGDVAVFAAALDQLKVELYPADGALVEASVQRVVEAQRESGALKGGPALRAADLFTNALVGS